MEFSKPGFIHHYCTPNAVLTLAEYLEDYASAETKEVGYSLILREVESSNLTDNVKSTLREKLDKIRSGGRDLYY